MVPEPPSIRDDKVKDEYRIDPNQKDQDELLRLQYDFDFIQNLISAEYIKYLNR